MKNHIADLPVFGHLPDGTPVHRIALGAVSGLRAEILTYGGTLHRLQVPGKEKLVDVILSHPDFAGYLQYDYLYLGALVGRYCNRIADARFVLDGHTYRLPPNYGKQRQYQLHGGAQGFSRRIWTVNELGANHVVLGYESPAGDQGYPGHLRVSARYTLTEDGLQLVFHATTDATTPVNLTHHPYFNLSGNPALPANRQWLRIPADSYLPSDAEQCPQGEVASVGDTPFDLRKGRRLSETSVQDHEQLRLAGGYDHCLVLQPWRTYSAELHSPDSGITMRVTSPKPGLQLYGGQALPEGLSGLCLEPQYFPNSPNIAHFPSTLLHPGQKYIHHIGYQFSLIAPV